MEIIFILPILVTVLGIFLFFKLDFFFILHPIRTLREFFLGLRDRDSRRSFFLALSGTLGVGNIFGVAAGLMIGGAGALFWIFISSLFSAIIKYAEVSLVFSEKAGREGMAGLIGRALCKGKALSFIYAGLTVALSLFMGAAMQTSALCDVATQTLKINPVITAFVLALFILPALIGGAQKIENITEFVIPLTTIIYIILCFCAILVNADRLGGVVLNVVYSALSSEALVGGGLAVAIKEGYARGILSNEAGVGTSALAHARHTDRSPHIAGLFGMCEVLFDTTLLCTLTGLTILLSVDDPTIYSSPMSLVFTAFGLSVGGASVILLPLVFFFAYSTLICWFYYGTEYVRLYFGGYERIYLLVFLAFVCFSCFLPPKPLLYLTDTILLLMALLTLSVIIKRAERIKKELPHLAQAP